jgi:hypothetical protein
MAALIHREYAERRWHRLQQAVETCQRFDPRVQQQHGRRLWVSLLEVGDRESGREVNAAGDPIGPPSPDARSKTRGARWPAEPLSTSGNNSADASTPTPRSARPRPTGRPCGWTQLLHPSLPVASSAEHDLRWPGERVIPGPRPSGVSLALIKSPTPTWAGAQNADRSDRIRPT